MDDNKPWTIEIAISIALGIPIYISVLFYTPFAVMVAFGIHAAILICYFALIRDFGRGSSIEVGVVFFIVSALGSMFIPMPAQVEASRKAREQRTLQRQQESRKMELQNKLKRDRSTP